MASLRPAASGAAGSMIIPSLPFCQFHSSPSRPVANPRRAFATPTAAPLSTCRRQQLFRQSVGKCRHQMAAASADGGSPAAASSLPEPQPVMGADGQPTQFPNAAGIYAVFDATSTLQYVGMSRKVAVSVANHQHDMPDRVHAVAFVAVADASREALTAEWQRVVQEAVSSTGAVPAGNVKGNTEWTQRRRAARPEIKLTPGKGIQDLTVPLTDIIQQVVDQNRVVAFVKGTRTAPQCGFSHQVLTLLNESRVDYEVVNVLDDIYNPGLRETLKEFSQWPTIPQLYVDGEFVGGADVLNEMAEKGELKPLLAGSK